MEDDFKIQELIENKTFMSLTLLEKELVLKELTQDEYEQRHLMVLNLREFLADEASKTNPNEDYKSSIHAIMNSRKIKSHSNPFWRIITYKIPLSISVLTLLILFFFISFFKSEKPGKSNQAMNLALPNKNNLVVHDTVFVEKIATRYKTKTVVKFIENKKESGAELVVFNDFEKENLDQYQNPISLENARAQVDNQLKNSGKRASEQEDLNGLIAVTR